MPVPTIDTPLPGSGGPRNRDGYGGEIAALARAAAADAIARCRSILDGDSPLSAGPAIDACDLLLRGDKDGRRVAVTRLQQIVRDKRTPDPAAVRAAGLLLEATGRRAYRKGN